jgi:hypothetical protein
MNFEIISKIQNVETFSVGSGIRELPRLKKKYGQGKWRKRKGIAEVRFKNGMVKLVELHWYEANGIGKKEYKIKMFIGGI